LDIALKHAYDSSRGAEQNVPDHIRRKLSGHAYKLDLLPKHGWKLLDAVFSRQIATIRWAA